jgi:hypothetical protein
MPVERETPATFASASFSEKPFAPNGVPAVRASMATDRMSFVANMRSLTMSPTSNASLKPVAPSAERPMRVAVP